MSNYFFITRRTFPSDEESISSKLLVKSGMIYKNDNGIYTYLPFGFKVLENIKKIIREEMTRNNAIELLMPCLISNDILKENGRSKSFDEEVFNINSRSNKSYLLCPTHEDLFAMVARSRINSYRDLHFTLFQISNKFRDEIKTKYGIVRKKEFYMADAYSFDANDGGLDISYDKMYQTFTRIFSRLNLNILVPRANPLSMNGTESEEFQAICDYGDNKIVKCKSCPYCTNIEYAYSFDKYKKENIYVKTKELVKKEDFKLNSDYIKTIIIKVNNEYKMILLKNNAEINFYRLNKIFNTDNIELVSIDDFKKLNISHKFVGPINTDLEIIADNEIKLISNASCGSNKE
jgi:prolyl-tRNA synthetase